MFVFVVPWCLGRVMGQVENVVGALDAFHQVLQRRADAMEKHIPALRLKVTHTQTSIPTHIHERDIRQDLQDQI